MITQRKATCCSKSENDPKVRTDFGSPCPQSAHGRLRCFWMSVLPNNILLYYITRCIEGYYASFAAAAATAGGGRRFVAPPPAAMGVVRRRRQRRIPDRSAAPGVRGTRHVAVPSAGAHPDIAAPALDGLQPRAPCGGRVCTLVVTHVGPKLRL